MALHPYVQGDHLAQKFIEANKHWNLEKLYKDIANIKQQERLRRCKQLTATEKACLRGLLCNYSPAEIAMELSREPNGLRVDLSRGLYRYIESLTGTCIKSWSNVAKKLDDAGYKHQQDARKLKFPASASQNHVEKEESIDNSVFCDRKIQVSIRNSTPPPASY
ncbi:hypothetical protein IQ259_03560 [Fortiea sp. LEGE XX443]|uniref:hypothetical protein n=1 Tax=Fortiea sp. LEGE XX443 TaxID=1828611 RepID=UPI00187EED78|nr:hypothetical protein [Fortiea sp. LEGE XX443]MBE9004127.1 hypothetical protein [Fortiea sp. LEGE XX443]